MTNLKRAALAFGILLIGAALIPFVGMPSETFTWTRYTSAYQDAFLEINFPTGQPGSTFTVTGGKFPANSQVTVTANGFVLGNLAADSSGSFQFLVDTSSAETGFYEISASGGGQTAATGFFLADHAPLRAPDTSGVTFALPAGLAIQTSFLPFVPK